MQKFDQLVVKQMKTMDELLFIQSEIERCQEIERELLVLQEETKLNSLQEEISIMKQQLKDIQTTFQNQTASIIETYEKEVVEEPLFK
ncbi:YgaB family protein [Priestia filamentosa]|uniref:YgaB family protein n=1 Tax=Priestia filamentosa TaxID=1402861 RepID=UPI0002DDA500|nr:YgaB family protein [Priestia filamentosa]